MRGAAQGSAGAWGRLAGESRGRGGADGGGTCSARTFFEKMWRMPSFSSWVDGAP
jgi:hypothetical protein